MYIFVGHSHCCKVFIWVSTLHFVDLVYPWWTWGCFLYLSIPCGAVVNLFCWCAHITPDYFYHHRLMQGVLNYFPSYIIELRVSYGWILLCFLSGDFLSFYVMSFMVWEKCYILNILHTCKKPCIYLERMLNYLLMEWMNKQINSGVCLFLFWEHAVFIGEALIAVFRQGWSAA